MRPGQSETHPSSRALLHIPSRSSHHSLSHPSSCVSKTVSMILKKDSLKMKAFIETGHQEGKQNTWCSLKTLCTSMSCLEYCPLSNPMFCSKPMSSSVANILVHVLSLPPVQRLSVRSHPLGPFEQFLLMAVIKVNRWFPHWSQNQVDQQRESIGMLFAAALISEDC